MRTVLCSSQPVPPPLRPPAPGTRKAAAPAPREFPDIQVRLRRLPSGTPEAPQYKVLTMYSAVTKLDLPKRTLRRAPRKVPQWVSARCVVEVCHNRANHLFSSLMSRFHVFP
jgi:hypothetical protein